MEDEAVLLQEVVDLFFALLSVYSSALEEE
jgi:hypothetical protein